MTVAQEPADQQALALIAEACKKSALVWLQPQGRDRASAAWHVWSGDAMYVVSKGAEQRLPDMPEGQPVLVTVRSKDKGVRLLSWLARPTTIEPGTAEWLRVVPELHAKRLNAPDGEVQPQRWARESTVTRLEPTGELLEAPGRMSRGSHAAPPPPSPATTCGPLPFLLGRRPRRR